jgi:hypothetical protein
MQPLDLVMEQFIARKAELLGGTRGLSPSSLGLWLSNKSAWMDKYLGGLKEKQTVPMAVGQAFDCYVKAELLGCGVDTKNIGIDTDIMDEAMACGLDVFTQYKESGSLGELLAVIDGRRFDVTGDIRLPFEIETEQGTRSLFLTGKPDLLIYGQPRGVRYIDGSRTLRTVKPDWWLQLCFYQILVGGGESGVSEIRDFKVNGYMSAASPARGYRGHKDHFPEEHKGGILIGIDQLCFRNKRLNSVHHANSVSDEDISIVVNAIRSFVTWMPSEEDVIVALKVKEVREKYGYML